MIKTRPKYPTDLYDNIDIDNIQKAVVTGLIIPTAFPFDAGSSVTSEKCIIFEVILVILFRPFVEAVLGFNISHYIGTANFNL